HRSGGDRRRGAHRHPGPPGGCRQCDDRHPGRSVHRTRPPGGHRLGGRRTGGAASTGWHRMSSTTQLQEAPAIAGALDERDAEALTSWFDRETGWRLVTEAQTVRLIPSYVPSGPTAVAIGERHPARSRRGDPAFTRRRYVLLCLALAALERSDLQVSLGRV